MAFGHIDYEKFYIVKREVFFTGLIDSSNL